MAFGERQITFFCRQVNETWRRPPPSPISPAIYSVPSVSKSNTLYSIQSTVYLNHGMISFIYPNKVNVVCQCKEFIDLKLRNNEKKVLNTLNKDKNRVTIRYTAISIKVVPRAKRKSQIRARKAAGNR